MTQNLIYEHFLPYLIIAIRLLIKNSDIEKAPTFAVF